MWVTRKDFLRTFTEWAAIHICSDNCLRQAICFRLAVLKVFSLCLNRSSIRCRKSVDLHSQKIMTWSCVLAPPDDQPKWISSRAWKLKVLPPKSCVWYLKLYICCCVLDEHSPNKDTERKKKEISSWRKESFVYFSVIRTFFMIQSSAFLIHKSDHKIIAKKNK